MGVKNLAKPNLQTLLKSHLEPCMNNTEKAKDKIRRVKKYCHSERLARNLLKSQQAIEATFLFFPQKAKDKIHRVKKIYHLNPNK